MSNIDQKIQEAIENNEYFMVFYKENTIEHLVGVNEAVTEEMIMDTCKQLYDSQGDDIMNLKVHVCTKNEVREIFK